MCSIVKYLQFFEDDIYRETSVPQILSKEIINGVKALIKYEIRDVMTEKKNITIRDPYLISLRSIGNYLYTNEKDFLNYCNYYTEGLLDILDLSNSYITGSCIPACLISLFPQFNNFSKERISGLIDLLYPKEYTVPEDIEEYRKIIWSNEPLKIIENDGKYIISNSKGKVILNIEPGADIDIVVNKDNENSMSIINKHIEVIKAKYPEAQVTRLERKSSPIWEIKIPGNKYILRKRTIQIYIAEIKRICSHHVSMVRGFVTGNGSDRQVFLSATAIWSYINNKTYNYYYFAGKISPMEILLKYRQRGFDLSEISTENHSSLSSGIMNLITEYAERTPKWKPINIGNTDLEEIWIPTVLGSGPLFGYGNFHVSSLELSKQIVKENLDNIPEYSQDNKIKVKLGLEKGSSGKKAKNNRKKDSINSKFKSKDSGLKIRIPESDGD
jgi:hypothetical protein